jgi:flagellar basal body rod protein FlgG
MFAAAFCGLMLAVPASAGGLIDQSGYKVLPAIVRGNLAIFPVVAANRSNDTSQLLDARRGHSLGQVTVTEAGDERGLIRPGQAMPRRQEGAEVNRLVLYNNSSRPLLLAGRERLSLAASRIA